MKKKKGKKVATKLFPVLALALMSLMAGSVHAAIVGTPFLPEVDARFDAVEGNSTVNLKTGLHQKQIAVANYDFAKCGGSSTTNSGNCNMGFYLPGNALITRSYVWVTQAVAGAFGSKISFGCGTAGNIFPAKDLRAMVAGSSTVEGNVGASVITYVNIPSRCQVVSNISVGDLTAGKVTAFIEYVIHP